MCDPLTLAGIALTIGSTGANYAASQRVQAARDDAMAAERIRQRSLDREAADINQDTRKEYRKFNKDEAARGKELSDFFTEQQAEVPTEAALPTSASNVTVQEEAKQRAASKATTDQAANALGELRAFGDLLGDKSIMQAQDASRIGQIGGFKTGSSNVLSYELDDANHAGDGLKLFGDILGGVGSLATMKGLSTPGATTSGFPAAPSAVAPKLTFGDILGHRLPTNMAAGRLADLRSMPGYAAI